MSQNSKPIDFHWKDLHKLLDGLDPDSTLSNYFRIELQVTNKETKFSQKARSHSDTRSDGSRQYCSKPRSWHTPSSQTAFWGQKGEQGFGEDGGMNLTWNRFFEPQENLWVSYCICNSYELLDLDPFCMSLFF